MKAILIFVAAVAPTLANGANVIFEFDSPSGNWDVGTNWTNDGDDGTYPDNSVPADPLGDTDRVFARIETGDGATVDTAPPHGR